jgi:hypothetical protein
MRFVIFLPKCLFCGEMADSTLWLFFGIVLV